MFFKESYQQKKVTNRAPSICSRKKLLCPQIHQREELSAVVIGIKIVSILP